MDGRLQLTAKEPTAEKLGMMVAATWASAEICENCGGKGNPQMDRAGQRAGCRCANCAVKGQRRETRSWLPPETKDHENKVSPGQWTADIRGGFTGGDWDISDWRNYGRLETQYEDDIAALMRAADGAEEVHPWPGYPGWAGLLRGLFLCLRPEQDERPDDPDHVPWRLRWMKEKWGMLDVRTTEQTDRQRGMVEVFETLSESTCIHCGMPGKMRYTPSDHEWVRPECDTCWAKTQENAFWFVKR